MAGEFDISSLPVEGQEPPKDYSNIDMSKSVLSPEYRARDPFGAQEIGGMLGGVAASSIPVVGKFISPVGAGIGGAIGETYEQLSKDEPFSLSKVGSAGFEEAAWDVGGNLVLKGLGKTLRFASDKLGFTQKDIPDASKAAQTFLEKQGSSLPIARRNESALDEALTGLVRTPVTADIFKKKEKEIYEALLTGQKDVLKQFPVSAEFEQALRSGTSAQKASGMVLHSFIKEGEQALSNAVEPIYKDIFKDTQSRVSTFDIKQWSSKMLSDPAALTAGQRSILKEMDTLPPQVDMELLHRIRSRWLAENRDKYSSLGTEKDSRASATISELIKKLDNAMDFSAQKSLNPETLAKYKKVTETYRNGIQSLNTDSIMQAMTKNPEEVGGYLFAAGKETPISELYKSVAAAGTLAKKPSSEIINALRVGYLDAMTHTPENMLKFAKEVEQNKDVKNTFNMLFSGTPQIKAIEAMNEAAKKGLISPQKEPGLNLRTAGVLTGVAGAAAGLGTGYVFLLNPEDQNKALSILGASLVSGGGLILSQRQLAKIMLDPKGARAITYLSKAKEKSLSPTVLTKVIFEPIYNSLNKPADESFTTTRSVFDISNLPVKD
jgi:hypothetical protein